MSKDRVSVKMLASASVLTSSFGTAALGQVNGYELLSDWDALPQDKTYLTAGLASSYDRSGANNDWNQYHSPTGHLNTAVTHNGIDVVVTEITGPGLLTRYWMPHAAADMAFPFKVWVDGVLVINSNSDLYLGGGYGYTNSPLTNTRVGGQYSYEPIVFGESLRIESKNYTSSENTWAKGHHYYQANYFKLAAGTQVTPYSGSLTFEQQQARTAAVAKITNVGANPGSSGANALPTVAQSIAAGQSLTLANVAGAGTVRALTLKMDGASDAELDGLRLRVRYGDTDGYAVDVPVSHFFGAGHERAAYKSVPLGTDSTDGFYSFWPMPFRDDIEVELYNASGQSIDIDGAGIKYDQSPVGADVGYLHAQYNREDLAAGAQHHQILDVEGRGHYVGNLLDLQYNGVYRNILEGDDIITIDGSTVLYGTGLEDAYNGGYYYNHVIVQTDDGEIANPESGTGPFSGLLRMNFDTIGDTITRTDQYRWLIGDPVPFSDGLNVKIENYGARASQWGSTAFYYLVVPEPAAAGLWFVLGALAGSSRRARGRRS